MKPFTILSHNAFWFQGAPFPTDQPAEPDAQVLARLGALYREIDPDVICLQEIQSLEVFEMVRDRLGMPGCYCPGRKLPQYGGAVYWRPDQGRLIHDAQRSGSETQRMWQIVEVNAAGQRLRICNVHLPSNRQLGPEKAAAQRLAELRDAFESSDAELDIILGDFNERPPAPAGVLLESYGYADTAVLADRGDVPTNTGESRGDYIWISRRMAGRLRGYEVTARQMLACPDLGRQYLSDHLPLWITLG